jgi:hypothetical protein
LLPELPELRPLRTDTDRLEPVRVERFERDRPDRDRADRDRADRDRADTDDETDPNGSGVAAAVPVSGASPHSVQ